MIKMVNAVTNSRLKEAFLIKVLLLRDDLPLEMRLNLPRYLF